MFHWKHGFSACQPESLSFSGCLFLSPISLPPSLFSIPISLSLSLYPSLPLLSSSLPSLLFLPPPLSGYTLSGHYDNRTWTSTGHGVLDNPSAATQRPRIT